MRKKLIVFIFVIGTLVLFFYFQNNSIVITMHNIFSKNIPTEFKNYKIVHLSDLHNKSFGKEQKKIVKKIKTLEPDLIVFTGDLIDSSKGDLNDSLLLLEKIRTIAPVYYVTGNHEWWSGKFDSLESKLNTLNINVLRNMSKEIKKGNSKILITGIDDPAEFSDFNNDESIVESTINSSLEDFKDYDGFKILLSHRPELIHKYLNFDLVLSGHVHGGQVRLPFIGGVVAPNQGIFPKYDSGEYTLKDTQMIVSRGLGNSIIPIRIFNRPEIVFITLDN